MNPDVSVVILADYAPGDAGTYRGLRAALRGLANQSFAGAAEFILVESDCFRDRFPDDLTTILPALRTVFAGAKDSFSLRNIGVRHATADIVAFLDADCVPERDWLRYLVAAFDREKDIAVVSGRTTYGGAGPLKRTLALLSRAYVDRGDAGEIFQLSNHNAAYRRSILMSHPFPSGASPFVTALHAGAIMSAGGRLSFEPQARVVHAYGGWAVEREVSRHAGWATVAIRQVTSKARLSCLLYLGSASIPVFVLVSLARSWRHLLRLWRYYGLAWYEVPFGFALATAVNLMQIPGMRRAFRGEKITDTLYR
jgi:glycosyltransferase involved in cell wall biosynthesis